jgi:hypothetical protein
MKVSTVKLLMGASDRLERALRVWVGLEYELRRELDMVHTAIEEALRNED